MAFIGLSEEWFAGVRAELRELAIFRRAFTESKTTGAELRADNWQVLRRPVGWRESRDSWRAQMAGDRGLNGQPGAINGNIRHSKQTFTPDSARYNEKEGAENRLHHGSDRIEPQPKAMLPLTEGTK